MRPPPTSADADATATDVASLFHIIVIATTIITHEREGLFIYWQGRRTRWRIKTIIIIWSVHIIVRGIDSIIRYQCNRSLQCSSPYSNSKRRRDLVVQQSIIIANFLPTPYSPIQASKSSVVLGSPANNNLNTKRPAWAPLIKMSIQFFLAQPSKLPMYYVPKQQMDPASFNLLTFEVYSI